MASAVVSVVVVGAEEVAREGVGDSVEAGVAGEEDSEAGGEDDEPVFCVLLKITLLDLSSYIKY